MQARVPKASKSAAPAASGNNGNKRKRIINPRTIDAVVLGHFMYETVEPRDGRLNVVERHILDDSPESIEILTMLLAHAGYDIPYAVAHTSFREYGKFKHARETDWKLGKIHDFPSRDNCRNKALKEIFDEMYWDSDSLPVVISRYNLHYLSDGFWGSDSKGVIINSADAAKEFKRAYSIEVDVITADMLKQAAAQYSERIRAKHRAA